MEIIEHTMPDAYTLLQAQDLHIGPKVCFTRGITRLVDRAAEKGVFLTMPGDLADSITSKDKRFSLDEIMTTVNTPGKQRDWLVKKFKPVKDKILAIGTGNHEMKLNHVTDLAADIANALGAPYGAYRYQLKMMGRSKKLMHKLLFTHGRSVGRSRAKDPIQRRANYRAAFRQALINTGHTDCIYMGMGHTHQMDIVEPTINENINLIERNNKLYQENHNHSDQRARYIPPEARWYAVGGSFLRALPESGSGQSSYAEVAMYEPVKLGWLEIRVEDRQVVGVDEVVI